MIGAVCLAEANRALVGSRTIPVITRTVLEAGAKRFAFAIGLLVTINDLASTGFAAVSCSLGARTPSLVGG